MLDEKEILLDMSKYRKLEENFAYVGRTLLSRFTHWQ